jgi:uncharacterized membrane protein
LACANVGAGILVFVPIPFTVWLVYVVWGWVDGSLRRLFLMPAPDESGIIPAVARFLHRVFGDEVAILAKPGAGLLALILFIFVIGLLARTFLGRLFVRIGEAIVGRLPVIRTIYLGLKQILEAILSGGGRHFRDVVLFEYPRKGIYAVGFVTGTSRGEVQDRTPEETVNVFLPTTPNPTSGYLLLVPRAELTYLDMNVEDAVKLIISGGIVAPKGATRELTVSNPAGDSSGAAGPAKEKGPAPPRPKEGAPGEEAPSD